MEKRAIGEWKNALSENGKTRRNDTPGDYLVFSDSLERSGRKGVAPSKFGCYNSADFKFVCRQSSSADGKVKLVCRQPSSADGKVKLRRQLVMADTKDKMRY